MVDEFKLVTQAAELYYEGNLSQAEVADVLKISRPYVSRLLSIARENRIIEIKVIDPRQKCDALRKKVIDKYGIKDCVVISTQLLNHQALFEKIGRAGSEYIKNNIQERAVVGIGRGKTVREAVIQLESGLNKKTKVISLSGGLGDFDANWQPNELSRIAAEKMQGTCIYLYLQAIYEHKEIYEALQQDSLVRSALSLWDQLDWAIIGIGSIEDPINPFHKHAFQEFQKILRVMDGSTPVGNICHRLFDQNGHFCETNLNSRLVAISYDQLKKCPNVLALAGGYYKVEAIKAALRGETIKILITDALTAEQL